MSISPDDVKTYYDDFSRQRMLDYRIRRRNLRIEKAIRFFTSNIRADDTVLDIGCGIGVATEAVGKLARAVVGVDISEQNIWYAKQTVQRSNVNFHRFDVINEADGWNAILPRRPTVITLCDVIEHIPETDRPKLLKQLGQAASDDAKILLTFPSEFYQRYMAAESQRELQIIDNVITPAQIAAEASAAGFSITYFSLVDVWKHAQYVHCKLERTSGLALRVREKASAHPLRAKVQRLTDVADRILFAKARRRRYVDKVFAVQK